MVPCICLSFTGHTLFVVFSFFFFGVCVWGGGGGESRETLSLYPAKGTSWLVLLRSLARVFDAHSMGSQGYLQAARKIRLFRWC